MNFDFADLEEFETKFEGKIQEFANHLKRVHDEVAKSIHIIDKHSGEIDELSMKKMQDSKVFEDMRSLHLQLEHCKQQLRILNEGLGIDGSEENSIPKLMSLRRKKSSTPPPTPRPRDKSPGVLRTDIDDLKTFTTEHFTGNTGCPNKFGIG